jgi:hypothetical protein
MLDLSDQIASDEFARLARHPDFPKAFTRNRKLPLPALIATLLSMRGQSQQTTLDSFFASVCGTEHLQRVVSDRALAKARDHVRIQGVGEPAPGDWVWRGTARRARRASDTGRAGRRRRVNLRR